MSQHIMPTYRRLPLQFARGAGSYLYTQDGDAYLDFAAGIAVMTLGHCDPRLIAALEGQAGRLWHVSNLYTIPEQEAVADLICAHSFAEQIFFCNSGAEAIEGLIKTARKYHAARGHPEKYKIITFKGCFHGRTLGALAATGNPDYLDGFGPPLSGFVQVPLGDSAAVRAAIDDETAAILIEPVQGEGGLAMPTGAFLSELRALADHHQILLAFDEVQCGIGRTGTLFAHQKRDLAPDIMAIAKGLGSGFPVGAVLATRDAAQGMVAGTHGSTFGGNPLAMTVAHTVLKAILEDGFLQSVSDKGMRLAQGLSQLIDEFPDMIDDVRGDGLMRGLHCVIDKVRIVDALRDEKLLSVGAGDNVVRLLPPLTVSDEEIGQAVQSIRAACQKLRDDRVDGPAHQSSTSQTSNQGKV